MSSDFVIAFEAPLGGAVGVTVPKAGVVVEPIPAQLIGIPAGSALFLGIGLRLALPAADRRAENIAQAGAGVRRAEFGHRLFLLVDLARLDRQRDLAGRLVELGDLGVDPLANRETVGALLAAVTRQLGLADEAGHAVGQLDIDAGVRRAGDRRGHDVALLDLGHAGLERIGLELLDAERDALLLDIDVEHLDPDHLALAIILHRLFAGLVPVDIRQMDHAVDVAGQADEQAELGGVADLALDLAAGGMFLEEGFPRVGQGLLEAEADAPLLRVDIEHHDLDLLAGRDDLARVHVLLGPAHFGDMDQALVPRLQLHKGAVVGDVGDAALEFGIGRILEFDAFPRIGFELLHAERDALRLRVEADHLDLDVLADGQRLGRVVDAPPGDVGHVQEAVDPAQIDEGAV